MFKFPIEARHLDTQLSQEVVRNLTSMEDELALNGTRLKSRNELGQGRGLTEPKLC